MRRILGPLIAASVLAAGACGDDGGGPAAGGDFCTQYATFDDHADDIAAGLARRDPDDQTDREAAADDYDRLVDAMRAVDPPDEIAETWNDGVASSSALADAIRSNDQRAAARAMDDAEVWSADLEAYVTEACGTR